MIQNNKFSKIIQSTIIVTLFIMTSPTIVQITRITILNKLVVPFLLMLFVMYYVFSTRFLVNVQGFFLLTSFLLVILFSVVLEQSSSALSDVKTLFIYYLPSIAMMMLLFLLFPNTHEKKEHILNLVILFGMLQAILGILQFVLRSPILPIVVNGQQIVSSIYYVPGSGGTGDSSIIGSSYLVRASGTMGSGLGLGILCLSSLATLSLRKKSRLTTILELVLCIAIILTLTGAIYAGFFSFLIFRYLLLHKSTWLIKYVYYLLWFIGVSIEWFIAHIPQYIISLFPTIESRFNGIQYYQSILNSSLSSRFFGQNFTNNWQSLANATLNINNRYVVDNFFMYTFYNVGIFGIIILFFAYKNIMDRQLKTNSTSPMVALQLSVLMMGFANNVSSAFGIVGILALFSIRSSKDVNLEEILRE